MSSATETHLHPEVLSLAETLHEDGDSLVFAKATFASQSKKIFALEATKKQKIITDILVIAGRLQREDPDHSYMAMAQLMALAAKLLGNQKKAEDAFLAAGINVDTAKKTIGSQKMTFEDTSHNKVGDATASLLGVLRKNKS